MTGQQDHELSTAMREALIDALGFHIAGVHLVYAHRGVTRALIRRGLAVTEPAARGHRNVLTTLGVQTADRIADQTR